MVQFVRLRVVELAHAIDFNDAVHAHSAARVPNHEHVRHPNAATETGQVFGCFGNFDALF